MSGFDKIRYFYMLNEFYWIVIIRHAVCYFMQNHKLLGTTREHALFSHNTMSETIGDVNFCFFVRSVSRIAFNALSTDIAKGDFCFNCVKLVWFICVLGSFIVSALVVIVLAPFVGFACYWCRLVAFDIIDIMQLSLIHIWRCRRRG